MPDIDPRIEDANRTFCRLWYGQARSIEEQIDDPEQRWAILLAALRQTGWPKEEHCD